MTLLAEAARTRSLDVINANLSAAIDLRSQVRHAYWNVRGGEVTETKHLLEVLSAVADDWSNLLAERAIALEGPAVGTLKSACRSTCLTPYGVDIGSAERHLNAVGAVLAEFGERTCIAGQALVALGDTASAQVLSDVARSVDALRWFVLGRLTPADTQGSAPDASQPDGSQFALGGSPTPVCNCAVESDHPVKS